MRAQWENHLASDNDPTNLRGRNPEPDFEPEPPRRGALPWLLALLAGAGLAALFGRQLDERAVAHQELASARDEAADLRKNLQRTENRLTAADKERRERKEANALLERVIAAHSGEHEANEKLIGDLRSKLDAKEGEVSGDASHISVNLVDEILFKSGDANLSPGGRQVLTRVGEVLKKLQDKQILIGGHTDDRPIHTAEFPSNWELSTARAVNVVHYLQETVGVDPHKLAAAGYSEFHPRAKVKARNRRIEILLTPIVQVKPVEKKG